MPNPLLVDSMCEAVSVTGAGFDQGSHPVNLCANTLSPLLEKNLSERWGGWRKRWRHGLTFRLAADTTGACRVCGCPDTRLSLTTSHVGTLRGTHCRRHPVAAAKVSGAGWQAQDRLHSSNGMIILIIRRRCLWHAPPWVWKPAHFCSSQPRACCLENVLEKLISHFCHPKYML